MKLDRELQNQLLLKLYALYPKSISFDELVTGLGDKGHVNDNLFYLSEKKLIFVTGTMECGTFSNDAMIRSTAAGVDLIASKE